MAIFTIGCGKINKNGKHEEKEDTSRKLKHDTVEKSTVLKGDLLPDTFPAPYQNKGGILLTRSPHLKEVPAVNTSWGKKIDFNKVGFYIGNKSLNIREGHNPPSPKTDHMLYIVVNGQTMASISLWGATEGGSGYPCTAVDGTVPDLKVDYVNKRFSWRKEFYLDKAKKKTAFFHYEVALQKNGLLKLSWNIEATQEQWDEYCKDIGLFVYFGDFSNKKIVVNGKTCSFLPKEEVTDETEYYAWRGKFKELIFNSEQPENGFSLMSSDEYVGYLKEIFDWRKKVGLSLRLDPPRNSRKISLLLDISKVLSSSLNKSQDIHAGIDFWKSDRLHVPDYSKTGNLIQNPSFESGLRYYTLMSCWAKYKKRPKPVFAISDTEARFGNRSLQINCWKGDDDAGFLQTFAIPVEKGARYTLSYYAKASSRSYLQLKCVTDIWMHFPELKSHTVGTEWKRYKSSFTAPDRAVTILFKGEYYGSDKNNSAIFIDGVQLEKGYRATSYIDQKITACLLTSDKDNFLNNNDPVTARFEVAGPKLATGTAKLKLKTFFYDVPWTTNISFTTDDKGQALVALPSLEKFIKNGLYVIRADIAFPEHSAEFTDFFRISRMRFLENRHMNKDIFASNLPVMMSRGEDVMKRCRQIGIGACNYYKDKYLYDLFAKYGIWVTAYSGTSTTELEDGREIVQMRSFKNSADIYLKNLTDIETVTPELAKQIEDGAYNLAKENPWINLWAFHGECNGYTKFKVLQLRRWKDFGKMLIAFRKGIKRFNPEKTVLLTGGPSNMNPQSGTRFLENVIKGVGGKVKFDMVAIHPYRATPSNPDLDSDADKFFSMLDRNGYKDVPVIWNEGIYYIYYDIPAWGLTPYHGCSSDHYHTYCPSYDMGWGERISAAYFARSWLVALKYQKRVKEFNGWASWLYMDAYLAPLAVQKIPNTLGNILGNAYFKKDIRFAPKTRCYVFENENKQPVAAIWSQSVKGDHGQQPDPKAVFNFNGNLLEIRDLMGNQRSAKVVSGLATIPLSPFPIFLIGKPDSLNAFCDSIREGRLIGENEAPITITGNPIDRTLSEIVCRNYLSREFKGTLEINNQCKSLLLKSAGSAKFMVPLSHFIKFDKIEDFSMPVKLRLNQGGEINENIKFNAFAIHKIQQIDWSLVPAIKITNRTVAKFTGGTSRIALKHKKKIGTKGDLDAIFQAAWDDTNLYLKVTVVDDKLYPLPKGKNVGSGWQYDSLQLYFDTFCDARERNEKGNDSNDYNYDIVPISQEKAIVYRRFAPEQQIAGGLDAPKPNMIETGVKCVFSKTSNGYSYELTFPNHLLLPVHFEKNSKTGFGIYINDNDGNGLRSSLTLTPKGTGCYMRPDLYPVMLFSE